MWVVVSGVKRGESEIAIWYLPDGRRREREKGEGEKKEENSPDWHRQEECGYSR